MMIQTYELKLAHYSLYTFIIGAILGLTAVFMIGNLPPTTESAQWAEVVSSKAYITSYYLLAYAFLLPIPGFWAIHRLFSKDKKTFTVSFFGMILAILGSALPMMTMGVTAFAYPALVKMPLYQAGDIITFISNIFMPDTMIFLLFSGFYYLIGLILLGIVLWKEKKLSLRIASIALIAHAFLIILPELMIINLLSWFFLLLSSALLVIYSKKYSAHL